MPSTLTIIKLVDLGLKDTVEKLIEDKKCDVNEKDDLDARAVHVAADRNDVEMLALLVKNGAEIDVKDRFQRTPLSIAQKKGNKEVEEFIAEKLSAARPTR